MSSYLPTATSEYRRQLRARGPEAALRAITGDVLALPRPVDPWAGRLAAARPLPTPVMATVVASVPVDPWPEAPF